jgi:hypothetical protein
MLPAAHPKILSTDHFRSPVSQRAFELHLRIMDASLAKVFNVSRVIDVTITCYRDPERFEIAKKSLTLAN